MTASRITLLFIVLIFIGVGFFHYSSYIGTGPFSNFPFKLGLDLNGGTRLLYDVETQGATASDVNDSLSVLKEVIEQGMWNSVVRSSANAAIIEEVGKGPKLPIPQKTASVFLIVHQISWRNDY